ncbi:MAG: CDP-alcohol phosphatidyltransferase family protein [Nanoarchaeota archaeon]|nr:CDP-alcohol phosphatidyltransferase family protein [Nanoarchaeota archaeon]
MAIDLKEVKNFWEKRAEQHSDNQGITNLEEDNKLQKLKKDLEEKRVNEFLPNLMNKTVLDLAGGYGRWAFKFANKAKEIHVVNYCFDLIALGKKKCKEQKINNIKYFQASAQDFESKTKYDIIFISGLLIYLNDKDLIKLGEKIRKYSHENTKIILRDGTGIKGRYEINRRFSEALQTYYSATYRTPEQYIEFFKTIGFEIIKHDNMFEEGCELNKFPETRLRIYKFNKKSTKTEKKKLSLKEIREGKHIKEGLYTDILRVPHVTLTYFIVHAIKDTKITPNQITLFSMILLLVASYFYASGTYIYALIASLLYYLSFVFDTVDGNLARQKDMCSPLGGWYDKIADRIMNPILFFAIAWGIYLNNPSVYVWIWTFTAFAVLEFSVIVQYNFRVMFNFGMDEVKKERKKRGWLKEFMLNDFFLCHSIILFSIFGILEYYMIFFTLYGGLFDIAMVTVMTYKAKKHLKNENRP